MRHQFKASFRIFSLKQPIFCALLFTQPKSLKPDVESNSKCFSGLQLTDQDYTKGTILEILSVR